MSAPVLQLMARSLPKYPRWPAAAAPITSQATMTAPMISFISHPSRGDRSGCPARTACVTGENPRVAAPTTSAGRNGRTLGMVRTGQSRMVRHDQPDTLVERGVPGARWSVRDVERRRTVRVDLGDRDVVDAGRGRAVPAPGHELVDRVVRRPRRGHAPNRRARCGPSRPGRGGWPRGRRTSGRRRPAPDR